MNYMNWGDEITVTHLGLWGQRSNTYRYTFTGQIGHFPDIKYRFTQIGDNSVYKDRFEDLILDEKNCVVGHKTALIEVDKIIKESPDGK